MAKDGYYVIVYQILSYLCRRLKQGEDAHDYMYGEKGNLIDRPMRELTDQERKDNADFL